MWLWALIACNSTDAKHPGAGLDTAGEVDSASEGSGHENGAADGIDGGAEGGSEPAARLLPAEVTAAGAVALGALYAADPRVCQRQYEALRATGDPRCPLQSGAYVGQFYWEGACTADSGVSFDGWALSAWREDHPSPEEGRRYDAVAWYYGMARVTDAEGRTFEGWGNNSLTVWESLDGGRQGVSAAVGGLFSWDGPEAGWLGDRADHGWELQLERDRDGALRLYANGGIGLLEGVFDAFAMDELRLDEPAGGCALEPTGPIHLREAATGRWYTVAFDVADCDGCGALSVREGGEDQVFGEACLPWQPLLDWELDPWSG